MKAVITLTFSSTGKDSSKEQISSRACSSSEVGSTSVPDEFFLDQFESLSYRSLVYTEFGGLTGIKVIRNFFPNFASFDRSFFEFVWLTDEYFPAEKEIVLFLPSHAR